MTLFICGSLLIVLQKDLEVQNILITARLRPSSAELGEISVNTLEPGKSLSFQNVLQMTKDRKKKNQTALRKKQLPLRILRTHYWHWKWGLIHINLLVA